MSLMKRYKEVERPKWMRKRVPKERNALHVRQLEITQKGLCAICGGMNKSGYHLSIDHDHVWGTIRELLCSRCNMALGLCRDDLSLLVKMARYISKHKRAQFVAPDYTR